MTCVAGGSHRDGLRQGHAIRTRADGALSRATFSEGGRVTCSLPTPPTSFSSEAEPLFLLLPDSPLVSKGSGHRASLVFHWQVRRVWTACVGLGSGNARPQPA